MCLQYRVQAHKSLCMGMNSDIEKFIKNCSTFLRFQQTQPKEQIIHPKIPRKPWEVVGADMSTLHNKNYLCILDYHSKFPVIKRWKTYQQTA